jgi:ribosomal protein L4
MANDTNVGGLLAVMLVGGAAVFAGGALLSHKLAPRMRRKAAEHALRDRAFLNKLAAIRLADVTRPGRARMSGRGPLGRSRG